MTESFDELVAQAAAVGVEGWEFSWLHGRATEERPSWGYQRLMGERMAVATAALDIQTGGGEVLAGVAKLPPVAAATESWPPNLARATRNLRPRGVVVVADNDEPPLPFADGAFDLVVSRHPVTVWWEEIARVLEPGGVYLSQQIGPDNVHEIKEFFRGPLPLGRMGGEPELVRARAEVAGLDVVDLRSESLRLEFFDVGAMVYFLRKVIWIVPDFSVEKYRDRLADLHRLIEQEGRFVAHSRRVLIEARKPVLPEAGVVRGTVGHGEK
jgi:SAM-dependent methyltransferase